MPFGCGSVQIDPEIAPGRRVCPALGLFFALAQLADIVSFVTQDNFLFNCSIKENIRLGKPEHPAARR